MEWNITLRTQMLLHSFYLSFTQKLEKEREEAKKKKRFSPLAFSLLSFFFSPRLEQQHRVVPQVEVDEVLGLVRDVGTYFVRRQKR